jgi:hypothetical protein
MPALFISETIPRQIRMRIGRDALQARQMGTPTPRHGMAGDRLVAIKFDVKVSQ